VSWTATIFSIDHDGESSDALDCRTLTTPTSVLITVGNAIEVMERMVEPSANANHSHYEITLERKEG
jgi:hypothetical protein